MALAFVPTFSLTTAPTRTTTSSSTTPCTIKSTQAPCNIPAPLHIGESLSVDPAVVLAPMAGVTNYPFRKLCRSYGAALYVSEMVLASSVITGCDGGRVHFGPDEDLRSAQLYTTDAESAAQAAKLLISRHSVSHIDLNFGCPAPKVLRRGGGAAIPANEPLLRQIASAVVEAAAPYGVPVTAKMRAGITTENLTYISAGLALQECGVAAVTLHARTADELYDSGRGGAGWGRIRELREVLDVPVIGNGDVFTAADALDLVRETGAAGVAIGRGCLGRPWLFRDLRQAFSTGRAEGVSVPGFDEVKDVMVRHVTDFVDWAAKDGVNEEAAIRSMRKWFGWYWRGYSGLPEGWVRRLCLVRNLQEMRELVDGFDGNGVGFVLDEVVAERGKVGRAR